jgi:hypothetical protein
MAALARPRLGEAVVRVLRRDQVNTAVAVRALYLVEQGPQVRVLVLQRAEALRKI